MRPRLVPTPFWPVSTLRLTLALVPLIVLIGASLTRLPYVSAASGPALTVDVAAERHPISPDSYGITFWWDDKKTVEITFAQAIRLPVNRSGGDTTTRYNSEVDSSNAGSDWYFMGGNGQANPTPGAHQL